MKNMLKAIVLSGLVGLATLSSSCTTTRALAQQSPDSGKTNIEYALQPADTNDTLQITQAGTLAPSDTVLTVVTPSPVVETVPARVATLQSPRTTVSDTVRNYTLSWGKTAGILHQPYKASFNPAFSMTKPYTVDATARLQEENGNTYLVLPQSTDSTFDAIVYNIVSGKKIIAQQLVPVGQEAHFIMTPGLEQAIQHPLRFQVMGVKKTDNPTTPKTEYTVIASYRNGRLHVEQQLPSDASIIPAGTVAVDYGSATFTTASADSDSTNMQDQYRQLQQFIPK